VLTSAGPASAFTAVTGPRAAHNSETACGAMSHSAPLSRRHGVLNGLDSISESPNHPVRPPIQPPCAVTSASQARISVRNLNVKKTTDATPLSPTASASSSAPRVRKGLAGHAPGRVQWALTLLPASATIPAWRPREVAVLVFAASIPVRASSMATDRKMRLSVKAPTVIWVVTSQ
jgi:hypothetical protein